MPLEQFSSHHLSIPPKPLELVIVPAPASESSTTSLPLHPSTTAANSKSSKSQDNQHRGGVMIQLILDRSERGENAPCGNRSPSKQPDASLARLRQRAGERASMVSFYEPRV